jgi:hypothetical protein
LESWWVRPGSATVVELHGDDRLTVIDPEGGQPAEITVLAPDGREDPGALGVDADAPATVLRNGGDDGFLAALHARDGDWAHAIAAYHSETQRLGSSYRARVLAIWHPEGPPALADPRRAAYADFLPRSARYAAFAGCRCVSAPGQRPACRCD